MTNFLKPISLLLTLLVFTSTAYGETEPRDSLIARQIEAHIRFLADDLLEGRGLGSSGLELASMYIESQLRRAGLQPAFGDSYRQPFTLQGTTPDPNSSLSFRKDEQTLLPEYLTEFVSFSNHRDLPETLSGELVYAGFLIQAPELPWDDIGDADLSGKVLLVEVNEPMDASGELFDPNEMSYYGRWTYKYEQAERLGALGVLLIHHDTRATYGWEVVRNSWSLEGFTIPEEYLGCAFEGWVSEPIAEQLFQLAGLNYEEQFRLAQTAEFQPISLGVEASVSMQPTFREVETSNVGGLLPAASDSETAPVVVVTAHHDHIGLAPDGVYNGLVDNASAVATMLTLAQAFAEGSPLPINLMFVAVSAEEQGLWGSRFFATNSPVDPQRLWANLNLEMTNIWGPTKDLYAIGANRSTLDPIARVAAENLGYTYIEEQDRENGFFFRSDQFSFARIGVPGLWPHEGLVSLGEDPEKTKTLRTRYREKHYHQTTDSVEDLEDTWDLEGTAQIAGWVEEMIKLLARETEPPEFLEGSTFQR